MKNALFSILFLAGLSLSIGCSSSKQGQSETDSMGAGTTTDTSGMGTGTMTDTAGTRGTTGTSTPTDTVSTPAP